MKKFIIFLLLLSMCGDTSISEVESTSENNEVIEDSSTAEQDSNIPPLPTVSFDIIEIYETKLGSNYAVMQLKLIQLLKSAYDNIEII